MDWAALTFSLGFAFFGRLYGWWLAEPFWVGLALLGIVCLGLLILRWWWVHRSELFQANRRAETLLREQLTPQQYRYLYHHGFLDLPSRLEWNRIYRIPRKAGRVHVLQTCTIGATPLYRRVAELCVISQDPVPDADLVLAHKWMIEADEANYLTIARWIRPPHDHWYTERVS
jgi:hypothetical protein